MDDYLTEAYMVGFHKGKKGVEDELLDVCETLVQVINSHNIDSLGCDRDGETYCDCLQKAVLEACVIIDKVRRE